MTGLPAFWKAGRDIVLAAAGLFMLVHETLSNTPEPVIIGAGLILLGLPPALRLDDALRRNGK